MLRQRFNRTCLSPYDLAICDRVFDQVCSDDHLAPLELDAAILAVMGVAIFRKSHPLEGASQRAVTPRTVTDE